MTKGCPGDFLLSVRGGDGNPPTVYRPPLLDGRLKGPSVKKKGGPASGGPQPVEDLASAAELERGRPQMEVISGLL